MLKSNAVMPSLKGSKMVNVVPTKENVDYNRIYLFTQDPHFGKFEADRGLNKAHVAEIRKQIETGKDGAKYICPIRVDINTLNTSDGKHRYNAFVQAWKNGSKEEMKVIFEDLPENEHEAVDVIVKINSTQKNWGIPSYNNRLIVEGDENVISIKDFGESHPLCQKKNKKGEVVGFFPRYTYAIVLGRNATKDIKNGKLVVSKEQLAFAERMYSELEMLVNSVDYEMNSWFEGFAHAWYNIRKNDGAYNAIIEEVGMDAICKNIGKFLTGLHQSTKKSVWEERFRTIIWGAKNCC